MNLDLKSLTKEYEGLKIEITTLEDRAKELKEIILPHMKTDKKIQLKYGKLYLKSMPKWEYSPVVDQLKEALDDRKKNEQADGTAQMVENYVLEYRKDKAVDSVQEA